MKVVARIEKVAADQYVFDGRVFDSFLSARREMMHRSRLLRMERRARDSRRPLSRMHVAGT